MARHFELSGADIIRRNMRFLVGLGLSAGLLIGLISLWPHWPGDMIVPFRLQLVGLAVAGLVLSLCLARRALMGFAALVLMLHATPVALRLMQRPVLPATSDAGRPLSLVFSNVLADNRDYGRVIALAEGENADLFAAAETSPAWIERLKALTATYPYSYAPDVGIFGVALYAKRPFTPTLYRIGRYNMTLMRADFGDYVVYVAHPMPPANARLSEDNRLYIAELARRVAAETKPVIVTGDLNATLWSGGMRPLMRAKLSWPVGSGLRHTWPTGRALLGIQIDHVLTKGLRAGQLKVLRDVGSDHLPVRADLALPESRAKLAFSNNVVIKKE